MGRLRRASVQLPQLQAIARLLALSESQAIGGGGIGAGPRELVGLTRAGGSTRRRHYDPLRRPLWPSWRAGFSPIPTKSGASRASGLICGNWEQRRPGPASAASRSLQKTEPALILFRRVLVHQLQGLCMQLAMSTRASVARDARRSHRSVEGDEKSHEKRERERKRRYYIRGFEFRAISGLGRIGAGVASPSTSATRI